MVLSISTELKNYPSEGKRLGLMFDHSFSYRGEMENGSYCGYGILHRKNTPFTDDLMHYEGQFLKNLPHGKGRSRERTGEYEGDFVNGKKHGKGKFTRDNGGSVYIGAFKDDQICGSGTLYKTDGVITTGEFFGPLAYASGKVEVNLPDGTVVRTIALVGEFHNGKAEVVFKDGTVYNGEINRFKLNGKGCMEGDGWKIDARWSGGTIHGACKITWKDGMIFEGTAESGMIQGRGIIKYPSGNCTFEGTFVDSTRTGEGKLIFFNDLGKEIKGYWECGELKYVIDDEHWKPPSPEIANLDYFRSRMFPSIK
jgi:hypothetical protein